MSLCVLIYRRLFGVPDEITDMTRSLKMAERERLIYRTIIFGDRKCFGVYQVFIGVLEGLPEPPGKHMGHMGHGRGAHQPTRGGAPPLWQEAELEKVWGVRAPLSFSPTPTTWKGS